MPMTAHIAGFGGIRRDIEPGLLRPGEMRHVSNLRNTGGVLRLRRGFLSIFHYAEDDSDMADLWPVSLPFIPVPGDRDRASDPRVSQPDPHAGFWRPETSDYGTYPERRDLLGASWKHIGGFATAMALVQLPVPAGKREFSWDAKLLGINR